MVKKVMSQYYLLTCRRGTSRSAEFLQLLRITPGRNIKQQD